MLYIKDFLNKIKFSGKFYQDDITIYYHDRILNKLIPIKYKNIKREGNFLIKDNKSIPLHRIKEIRNKSIIIWRR